MSGSVKIFEADVIRSIDDFANFRVEISDKRIQTERISVNHGMNQMAQLCVEIAGKNESHHFQMAAREHKPLKQKPNPASSMHEEFPFHQVPPKQSILPFAKLKCTQIQINQITQLNNQIKSLSQHASPDQKAFQNQYRTINIEIDRIHKQIGIVQAQIDSAARELNDYRAENDSLLMDIKEIRMEMTELIRTRDDVRTALDNVSKAKGQMSAMVQRARRQYGIKTYSEGLNRIEEIDERIERETLTNRELKKLLAEKDRIQSGIQFFRQLEQSKSQIDPSSQDEQPLSQQLHELQAEIHELGEERDRMLESSSHVFDHLSELTERKRRFISDVNDLKSQLNDRFVERRRLTDQFEHDQIAYEQIQSEINILESRKLAILADAETISSHEREQRRKINAIHSLIDQLRRFDGNNTEEIVPSGKCTGLADALSLIAQVRKSCKKERQTARKQDTTRIGQISFDFEIRKLFEIVDIPVPRSIDEIHDTLQLLLAEVTSLDQSRSLLEMNSQSCSPIPSVESSM
jgi:DNA repair exonuclease SbcCD ATPase subunit